MVGNHVVEHSTTGDIDRSGGSCRGKCVGIDGGRSGTAHLDAGDRRDAGISIVSNAGDGCGKSKATTYLKTAIESAVADGRE